MPEVSAISVANAQSTGSGPDGSSQPRARRRGGPRKPANLSQTRAEDAASTEGSDLRGQADGARRLRKPRAQETRKDGQLGEPSTPNAERLEGPSGGQRKRRGPPKAKQEGPGVQGASGSTQPPRHQQPKHSTDARPGEHRIAPQSNQATPIDESSAQAKRPRRPRGRKFHGELTEGTPGESNRQDVPSSEKYRTSVPKKDDLTSRLIYDLSTPPYPDCLICFAPITPMQPTWSCSPSNPTLAATDDESGLSGGGSRADTSAQCCWMTFHLKCIRSWAAKSVKDVVEAWRARGEEREVIGVFAARLRIPSRRDWLRLTHVPTHALARVLVVTRVRSIAILVLALPVRRADVRSAVGITYARKPATLDEREMGCGEGEEKECMVLEDGKEERWIDSLNTLLPGRSIVAFTVVPNLAIHLRLLPSLAHGRHQSSPTAPAANTLSRRPQRRSSLLAQFSLWKAASTCVLHDAIRGPVHHAPLPSSARADADPQLARSAVLKIKPALALVPVVRRALMWISSANVPANHLRLSLQPTSASLWPSFDPPCMPRGPDSMPAVPILDQQDFWLAVSTTASDFVMAMLVVRVTHPAASPESSACLLSTHAPWPVMLPPPATSRNPVVQLSPSLVLAAEFASREGGQQPKCTNECAIAKRNARLAEALNINPDRANSRLNQVTYNDDLVAFARVNAKFCSIVEKSFADFLASDKKSQILPHMPEAKRKFVHDLAAVYRIDTQMVDQEPHRSVQLLRRIDSRVPSPLLSSVIAPPSTSASLGKLTDLRTGLQPLSRPGSSRVSPSPSPAPGSSGVGAGKGWTSVVARPPQAAPTPSGWSTLPVRTQTPGRSTPSPGPPRIASVPPPQPPPANTEDVPDNWEDET
ncbi:hypothetical protein ONZ51_g3817 [Trametes cubensis]|uniref:R3H domain-containing protein n=1 Tax=Trametes cubensis TaxID=1111947 RepID=A0AAD7TY25_9APHY|nr:hypothetical protein ONZ51_g3817 [Trametes cubensis]